MRRWSWVLCVGLGCSAGSVAGPDTATVDGGGASADPKAGPDCRDDDTFDVGLPLNVLGARVVEGRAGDATTLAALDALIAILGAADGPWSHRVVGPWVGVPGEAFVAQDQQELAQASVADVVVDGEGRRWLFAVDGDLAAMRAAAAAGEALPMGWGGLGGLRAAVEGEAGWEPVALSLDGEAPLVLVDPTLIALPGGGWRLYAFAVAAEDLCGDDPDPAASPGPHRIWAAASDDLLRWTALGVVWEAPEDATDPAVWCTPDGGECGLLVGRGDEPPDAARSEDGGETWSATTVSLPSGRLSMPDVAWGGDGLWMVAQGEGPALRLLSSPEGWTWTEEVAPGLEGSGPTLVVDGVGALGALSVWKH